MCLYQLCIFSHALLPLVLFLIYHSTRHAATTQKIHTATVRTVLAIVAVSNSCGVGRVSIIGVWRMSLEMIATVKGFVRGECLEMCVYLFVVVRCYEVALRVVEGFIYIRRGKAEAVGCVAAQSQAQVTSALSAS